MNCSMPGFPVLHYLQEFAQIHVHWVSYIIKPFILCRSLLLLPSIYPSIMVFFNDPADVGNLTCGSSAFPKTSLNIWKFMVHILLKPGLQNFEHQLLELLKLMSIKSVMPSNHLILCRSLLLPHSIFSSIRVFSNESFLHIRWPKYWRFSISPCNEYSELISFRIE